MQSRSRTMRLVMAALLAIPLLAGIAAPAAADVTGEFQAAADADLLEVSAVSLPPGCGEEGIPLLGELIECTFELAQLVVGDSEVGVDSGAGMTYEGTEGLSAYGHASNLDPDLLNPGGTEGAISEELLVESNALQPMGPESDSDQLAAFPENPLIALELATTSATAVDVTDGANDSCPDVDDDGRATIANGRNELLGLAIAPGALDGADLIGVRDDQQVSYAESRVDLVDSLVGDTGDGVFGLQSTATMQIAPLVLFGDAIHVEVGTPVLTVSHDGSGPSVDYQTPIVTVNGDPVVDGETIEFLDAIDLPGNPVLNLTVDIANAEDVQVDGNTATVSDVVRLRITLGDPEGDLALGVADIGLGDLNAMASMSSSGIQIVDCGAEEPTDEDPLREVSKDVSASVVAPGSTFDYVISVPNRGTCTLTDVTVVDTVSGPPGSEIVATQPSAQVDGMTATWTIDALEPNETRTFSVTVSVPDDAPIGSTYDDHVVVTADCDGEEVDGEDRIDDVPRVAEPTAPGCTVAGSNKAATHLEVMPGQTFSYLIHVLNFGTEDCGATTVTDELIDGLTFVSCSDDCTESNGTVTWELDNVPSGTSETLVITVQAPDEASGEHLPNQATIRPANGDSVSVATDGPLLDDQSILAPPAPAAPADVAPPPGGAAAPPSDERLPRTGGGLAAAAGLIALAAVARRRRP